MIYDSKALWNPTQLTIQKVKKGMLQDSELESKRYNLQVFIKKHWLDICNEKTNRSNTVKTPENVFSHWGLSNKVLIYTSFNRTVFIDSTWKMFFLCLYSLVWSCIYDSVGKSDVVYFSHELAIWDTWWEKPLYLTAHLIMKLIRLEVCHRIVFSSNEAMEKTL